MKIESFFPYIPAKMDHVPAPKAVGSEFVCVTITDTLTQMDNIYVSCVMDRGCPGFILFLPTMRQTLYVCCTDHMRAFIRNAEPRHHLDVMRSLIREYNPTYSYDNSASLVAFVIHLMERVHRCSDLRAVVDVREIRERGL